MWINFHSDIIKTCEIKQKKVDRQLKNTCRRAFRKASLRSDTKDLTNLNTEKKEIYADSTEFLRRKMAEKSKERVPTMKRKLATLVLGAFMITGLFGCGNSIPDDAVAVVNGEAITQDELDTSYNQLLQMYEFYGQDIKTDDVKISARNSVLENMITQKLLLQEAEKRELSVTDEEVDQAIQELLDTQYGGKQEDLDKAIAQAGMTMESFKVAQKESMIQDQLQQELVNDPETVDVAKARHILVESEKEATDLIAKLDGGADFAQLAKDHSTDTGSAVNGGDLGYFALNGITTSKMVDEFTAAINEMEPGTYSKTPVKSQFGYHIILLEDKQSKVNLLDNPDHKYDSVLEGIYRYGLQNLAQSLRADADIEILIDMEAVPEASGEEDNTAKDSDKDKDKAEEK